MKGLFLEINVDPPKEGIQANLIYIYWFTYEVIYNIDIYIYILYMTS